MRWLLVLFVGCYSPVPPAGAPCGVGDSCPSGLDCQGGVCLPPGTVTADAPVSEDAASDGPLPDACTTFASQLDTCTVAATGDLMIGGDLLYDTETHILVGSNGSIPVNSVVVDTPTGQVDMVIADNFTLLAGGNLRVTGELPFGVVAFGAINLNGTLDADEGGAGARGRTACGTAAGQQGTTNAAGSSGGGGGALRGAGGDGGKGDTNGTPVDGGAGGVAISLPAGVLGGCPGGRGGGGSGIGGSGGSGGGAVYLVARGTINLTGVIDVGGSGALRGHALSGAGGGGGSGGMILIEGPVVNVTGTLVSNGGGGSGGADDVAGNEGTDGEPGQRSTTRAKGGLGALMIEGGDGGDGGAGNTIDGVTSTDTADNGGGGGGGGCGFIAIGAASKSTATATISPALSPWPAPP